jgi:hypothetical protein
VSAGVWTLHLGDALLGEITVTGGDFPWLNGTMRTTAAFERLRPLFERELRLLDEVEQNVEQWEAAYEAIRDTGLELRRPSGEAAAEFILHVDGDAAWFRWSTEPFESVS